MSAGTNVFHVSVATVSPMGKQTESCGRCGMSTVVDAADGDGAGPDTDAAIEVADEDARRVSPAAWLGGLRRRLDAAATRLTDGR